MLLDVLLQNVPPQNCQNVIVSAEQRAFIFPLGRDVERYTYTGMIKGGQWSLETLNTHRDSYHRPFITASEDGFTLPSFGVWDDQLPVVIDFLDRFPIENQVNVSYGTTIDGRNIVQHDIIMQLPGEGMAEVQIQMDERPHNLAAKVTGNLTYGESVLQSLEWKMNFDGEGRPVLESYKGKVKKGAWTMFFQIEHAYAWSGC